MALSNARDIRAVCFDLDGTLVDHTVFIWSTLHENFGTDAAGRKQAADDYRAGKISYADWFANDLRLLAERGADRKGIIAAFGSLSPAPGARETLIELRRRGYRLGLISGSLDVLLDHFFHDILFDHVLINRIQFDGRGRIAGGVHTPYDLEGKADGLREIAAREGLSLEQCAFVGDNVNDLPVMRVAGLSIGVNIKSPAVAEAADVVIDKPDLRSILYLLKEARG
ncbi:MAG TPA: HAD family phosphatase [Myxococcota bacterium]|nr:HAD family phosphatase [Myxococcota bacterium]